MASSSLNYIGVNSLVFYINLGLRTVHCFASVHCLAASSIDRENNIVMHVDDVPCVKSECGPSDAQKSV